MKAIIRQLLVALCLFILACPVVADTDIGVSGQVRLRIENDAKSFSPSAATQNFADMRARVVVEGLVDDNAHVFIQFQDSRRAGADDLSGTLKNGKNGDVHQAWISIDNLGTVCKMVTFVSLTGYKVINFARIDIIIPHYFFKDHMCFIFINFIHF